MGIFNLHVGALVMCNISIHIDRDRMVASKKRRKALWFVANSPFFFSFLLVTWHTNRKSHLRRLFNRTDWIQFLFFSHFFFFKFLKLYGILSMFHIVTVHLFSPLVTHTQKLYNVWSAFPRGHPLLPLPNVKNNGHILNCLLISMAK